MSKERWLDTMRVYDAYERRFAQARGEKELRFPPDEDARAEILAGTKRMLRYKDSLVPAIRGMRVVSEQSFPGFRVQQLQYESWDRVFGSASLYLPEGKAPFPLVFVCCGHGKEGRLTGCYALMGRRLAKLGMAALIPDNLGQGDRAPMGHWDVVAPFHAGLTLQGMIVAETVGLIRHMQNDPRFDPKRFASCGNSGGGTLNVFLAALAPELCALSASGYPSEFSYILSKERKHCACNLLVGAAHGPEMWEILSLFAPKPLFLEQGAGDSLIPVDLAHRNARKLKNVYLQLDAEENFRFETPKTAHSWTTEDRYLIASFLAKQLGAEAPTEEDDKDAALLANLAHWNVPLPEQARTTDELAAALTGITTPEGIALEDVFPPTLDGRRLAPEELEPDLGRGSVLRVLAQMECALKKD